MDATILKPETCKLTLVRKQDQEVGTIINDICDYILSGDARRVVTAAAYLLVALAKRRGVKAAAVLKTIS